MLSLVHWKAPTRKYTSSKFRIIEHQKSVTSVLFPIKFNQAIEHSEGVQDQEYRIRNWSSFHSIPELHMRWFYTESDHYTTTPLTSISSPRSHLELFPSPATWESFKWRCRDWPRGLMTAKYAFYHRALFYNWNITAMFLLAAVFTHKSGFVMWAV